MATQTPATPRTATNTGLHILKTIISVLIGALAMLIFMTIPFSIFMPFVALDAFLNGNILIGIGAILMAMIWMGVYDHMA